MVSFTDVSSSKIFYLTVFFSLNPGSSSRSLPRSILFARRFPSPAPDAPLPLDHDAAAAGQHNTTKHTQLQIFETTALTRRLPCSRATVSQECITAYNDLKLNKKYKYIVYKLSDDYKEIVVEHASEDKDWEEFREKLINATSKSRTVRSAPLMN